MATPALDRRLGTFDAAAIIISNVIGSGIFLTPAIVASLTGGGWPMVAVWAVGGFIAFAGATAYAELAALRPHAGGEYVYLRAAFGPVAAFLTGWTSFVAGFSGAVAASAVGFASYLGHFVPFAADTRPLAALPLGLVTVRLTPQALVAMLLIVLLSLVHVRGLGPGRLLQNLLAGAKVTGLVALIALGLSFGHGSWSHLAPGPLGSTGGLLLALVPVMFSYSGWNAASYVAEEIRDPQRLVPRALALGTGAVVVLYIVLNLLYVYSLSATDLAGLSGSVLDVIGGRLFGPRAGDLVAALTAVSIAASVSAMTIAGPRVYFAMARDGAFFRRAAEIHPRFRTPSAAIGAQAFWSLVLVLTGSFDQLITYTGFAVVLFSGAAGVAVFVLRRRAGEPRAVNAWGYPYMPALFVIASALIVVNAIVRAPGPTAAGVAIIVAGLPLYWMFSRKARPQSPQRVSSHRGTEIAEE